MDPQQIAYLGLGMMGREMALNLAEDGVLVVVWNRTPAKAEALVCENIRAVASPQEAVTSGGIALSCLANDEAVEAVCSDDFLQALGPGGVHISMSTISPTTAEKLSRRHAGYGVDYVAAPVLGRPDFVKARSQRFLLSGPPASCERAQPILESLGSQVFPLGEEPRAAHAAKLAFNYTIATSITLMSEAFALAEKSGVDRKVMHSLMVDTVYNCPLFQGYGQQIVDDNVDDPLFKLSLGYKDMSLVADLARESLVPMPVGLAVYETYQRAMAAGMQGLDWSGVNRIVRQGAGEKE
ncbi:MAG: NAD(P)-dependent oxidoreductase [Candidatus Electrothrix sp. GW3-4]|uniref:NAD(P)-dependent oxidoreductase n=1 Tax=Candidatus Electrothrix sp. GW3-4 TaxID=3126740 RepID=UPI0030CE47F0